MSEANEIMTHIVTQNGQEIFKGTVSQCLDLYDSKGGNGTGCKIVRA